MPINFYKASPSNRGSGCSFSVDSKGGCVYLNFIQQNGWNAENKTGTFKGGKQCNIKFGSHEIGDMLSTIEQALQPAYFNDKATLSAKIKPVSFYHRSENQVSKINFGPYVKEDILKGMSLSVKAKKGEEEENSFVIGFTFGESVQLREFFKFALHRIFVAIHSADKVKAEAKKEANEQ